jgi:hypothetical protein
MELRPFIFLLLMHLASLVCGQNNPVDTITVAPTKDFVVSADLESPNWRAVEWIELPQRQGDTRYSTKVRLMYSEKGIYANFHCEDKKISATKTEDFTDLWKEDVFEIFFWTDESAPIYFEYELSPLNKELAILVPNFNGDFLGWKPWQYEGSRRTSHAVQIQKNDGDVTGWTGEFFIPYSLLKPLQNVPPKKGGKWRVNIYRIDYDNSARSGWAWKPVRTTFHDYESFGVMKFE